MMSFLFITILELLLILGSFCAYSAPSLASNSTANSAIVKASSVTVAQVGSQVITSREVMASFVIDQWDLLAVKEVDFKSDQKQKVRVDKIGKLMSVGSDQFKKQLALVQLEYLVIFEAENFSVGDVASEVVKVRAAAIQDGLKDWTEWKKLEMSSVEIEGIVSRKLRAKNFLRYKTESMGIQLSDSELREYYERNRIKFGSIGFDKIKENIREYLSQQNVELKMKDWVSVLKKKYQVRHLQYEELK